MVKALVEAQDLCGQLIDERHAARAEAQRAALRVRVLENSLAFKLGSAVLDAVRSARGFLRLPGALIAVVRYWRARQGLPEEGCFEAPVERPDMPGSDLVRAWHMERRPSAPTVLAELKVATVVDGFTRSCLAPDCRLLDLPASDYERMIDGFQPHLLFVESAWRGKDGAWMHKINPLSQELVRLVDACRRRGIPTVFWSKEDPSHFDGFIDAAGLFDHVLTTDLDCVERYRAALGHERVGVLGFACQPRIHNPVEEVGRRIAAGFAGSWYAQYPERSRDFEELVASVLDVMPVEIYDRNHGRNDPAFEFPHRFRKMIRGSLPYERIDEAYKACAFSITVNTIKTSPSMFARRVLELLASNTIAVSNHSVALESTFGDIVVMAARDDVQERLRWLRDSGEARNRLRLRGLREVMMHHTASRRLAEVARVAVGHIPSTVTRVHVVAQARSAAEMERVIDAFRAQRWPQKSLLLVVPEPFGKGDSIAEDVRLACGEAAHVRVGAWIAEGDWVAPWHERDYYGPCYLLDLMLATQYAEAPAIGKSACFVLHEGRPRLEGGGAPYREGSPLRLRSSILQSTQLHDRELIDLVNDTEADVANDMRGLSVDEFGYCRFGAGSRVSSVDVD
ncbi:glycosyltransferase [Luteimonas sp. SJ-92]|uniref:Glycosyltransferase n=1 Tax=Luteimonas salinisoli TaxID=2752307 RepID=A0A853J965_9GAMM|nr:glycosyltransferase [Luteimonas salinisoli]